jgi:hypothetical protein
MILIGKKVKIRLPLFVRGRARRRVEGYKIKLREVVKKVNDQLHISANLALLKSHGYSLDRKLSGSTALDSRFGSFTSSEKPTGTHWAGG